MRLFQRVPANLLTVRHRIVSCDTRSNQLAWQIALHIRKCLANFDKYDTNAHGENGLLIVTIFNKDS